MPLQQHLHNGLAHSADSSIFALEWSRSPLRVSPSWQMNGLPRTDSALAYGQCWYERDIWTDVGTDKVKSECPGRSLQAGAEKPLQ